jgi:outer membrane protein assembly factor BamB
MPVWGFSESILIDGDKLICTPGAADGAVMALDKATGKPIWKCKVAEGPTGDRGFLGTSGAAYSSAIAVDVEGVRQYIQLTATTLVGVAAADGKLLWRYDRASNTHRINCTTPIYQDGIVYAASAYDAGGGAVKLSKDASGAFTATEVFFTSRMKNHHGGMIIVDKALYGAAGGNEGGFLVCLDIATGNNLWTERRAPKGSLTLADERLYLRGERGEIILIEPNRERFVERGRFQQPERTRESAWTHPVIANGKLYIRDQDLLLCYDIKAK